MELTVANKQIIKTKKIHEFHILFGESERKAEDRLYSKEFVLYLWYKIKLLEDLRKRV